MKTTPLLLALSFTFGVLSASALDLRIGDTPARKVAKSSQITGKGIQGKCLPYAIALNQKLRAAGIPSRVVGYHTRNLAFGSANHGETRGHAVVVYNDNGRSYIMDNQSWSPRWVAHGSTHAMVAEFGGMDQQIQRAWTLKPNAPGSGIDEASRRALMGIKG